MGQVDSLVRLIWKESHFRATSTILSRSSSLGLCVAVLVHTLLRYPKTNASNAAVIETRERRSPFDLELSCLNPRIEAELWTIFKRESTVF